MSLVQLAHVCSHLQNASLARLGVTSIPHCRMHLLLAVELQKQGFLSTVILDGPSPPRKLLPPTAREVELSFQRAARRKPAHGETRNANLQKRMASSNTLGGLAEPAAAVEFGASVGASTPDRPTGETSPQEPSAVVASQELQGTGSDTTSLPAEENNLPAQASEMSPQELSDAEALNESEDQDEDEHEDALERELVEELARRERKLFDLAGRPADVSSDELGGQTRFDELFPHYSLTKGDRLILQHEASNQAALVTQTNRASRRLWLGLKYWDGEPVLRKAKMLSRPSQRLWLSHQDISKIIRGQRANYVDGLTRIGECLFLSTDKGIMEAREAEERRIGGMALCRVWG